MPMTPFEIAQEYKAAKNKMKQIQILADENLCSEKEIVQILLEQGCEVPKQYLPKAKKEAAPEPAPAPVEAPEEEEPEEDEMDEDELFEMKLGMILKLRAYNAIANLLPQVTEEEVSIYSFIDRCYGIVELVKQVTK